MKTAPSALLSHALAAAAKPQNRQLHISPRAVARLLSGIMLFLLFLHLVSVLLFQAQPESKLFKHLDRYFNVNLEQNFPTFFSAALLMAVSGLLFFVYKISPPQKGNRGNWLFLALVFLFLTLDEALELHEYLNHLLRLFIHNDFSGYLKWIWIVPYVALFAAVAFYNLRFVLQLPVATRNNFLLSGALYVGAAAGIESVEGHLMKSLRGNAYATIVTTTFQEVFEMAALILFIYGILKYIATTFPKVDVAIGKR